MDEQPDQVGDLSLDQLVALEERAAAREREQIELADDHDDDTIVLPWWQHPVNIAVLVVTAAVLAAMIGWMVGGNTRDGHSRVDTGFLHDMREHHEQAVTMGFIYLDLPDTDPGLRTVATSIVRGQSLEVGRMIQLLRDFGEPEANEDETAMEWMGMEMPIADMTGMATPEELDALAAAEGREADELFVRLMVAHHLGGVEMAEYAASNGSHDEVTLMASSMAAAQRDEIAELIGLLD